MDLDSPPLSQAERSAGDPGLPLDTHSSASVDEMKLDPSVPAASGSKALSGDRAAKEVPVPELEEVAELKGAHFLHGCAPG